MASNKSDFQINVEVRLGKTDNELKKVKVGVQKVGDESKKATKKVSIFKRSIGELASSLSILATSGLLAVFSGIRKLGSIAIDTIKVFVGFDRKLSQLKAISKGTSFEIGKLTAKSKELGATTEFTATQVTDLQIAYAKFGFSVKEIDNVTEATLDLATATGEDLKVSAEVVASTIRGFGLDASEASRVVDVMAESFTSSALDLDKFRESMKLVAPIAKAGNIELETVTALLAKLADAGLAGSIAGTGLKNLLSQLTY